MFEINIIPGEKLAIKMWDSAVDKGLGGLLSPYQIKREGKARTEVRRNEMLVLAQAWRDAEDIRKGQKTLGSKGEIIQLPVSEVSESQPHIPAQLPLPPRDTPSVIELVHKEALLREMRQSINFKKIFILAEQETGKIPDEQVSDDPVDEDWMARFKENAKDVSSEKLQQLWAKTLAGEIKQPGAYSLSTIEAMRRLTTRDAEKIGKLASMKIDTWILAADDATFYENAGINFPDLMELEDMGILRMNIGGLVVRTWVWESTPYNKFFECNGQGLLLSTDSDHGELKVPVHHITKVGQEIMSLGEFPPNLGYLKYFAEYLKKKGSFSVGFCDYKRMKDGEEVQTYNYKEI